MTQTSAYSGGSTGAGEEQGLTVEVDITAAQATRRSWNETLVTLFERFDVIAAPACQVYPFKAEDGPEANSRCSTRHLPPMVGNQPACLTRWPPESSVFQSLRLPPSAQLASS